MKIKTKELAINKIHKFDCIEGLKKLKDKSVQLSLVDPPYNVDLKYASYDDKQDRDTYKKWCAEWFKELRRVTDGIILITPGSNNLDLWFGIEKPKWMIMWTKRNANSPNYAGGINCWEPILYYITTEKLRHRVGIDVIEQNISMQRGIGSHPCPKPLKLFRKLVDKYSNEGDTVLDCFMGSGTTACAAKQLGRNFIGFETEEEYNKIANERLKQKVLEDWF